MSQKEEHGFWEAMNSYKSICKILNTAMPGQSFTQLAFAELFQFKPIDTKPLLDSMLAMCFLTYERLSLTYRVVATKEDRLALAKKRLVDINKLNAEIIKEHLRITEMMQLDLGWIPSNAPKASKAKGEAKDSQNASKAEKIRKKGEVMKELTQEIFSGQPPEVNWCGVDFDGLLSFGKSTHPRYTWASERWRGFKQIGERVENSGYKTLTSLTCKNK